MKARLRQIINLFLNFISLPLCLKLATILSASTKKINLARYTQDEVVVELNSNNPCECFEPSQGYQSENHFVIIIFCPHQLSTKNKSIRRLDHINVKQTLIEEHYSFILNIATNLINDFISSTTISWLPDSQPQPSGRDIHQSLLADPDGHDHSRSPGDQGCSVLPNPIKI
jgi:hypothetical protein